MGGGGLKKYYLWWPTCLGHYDVEDVLIEAEKTPVLVTHYGYYCILSYSGAK